MEHITDLTLSKFLPGECKPPASNLREMKKFVRLVGWAFWSSEKLYDWIEFDKTFFAFREEAGDFDQVKGNGMYGRPFKWDSD